MVRVPAQCLGGHWFESFQGLRFFLCPMLSHVILKAILYEERRALGMMIQSNSDERDTRSIDTLKRLTEIIIVVVVNLLSRGSIYTVRWIN